MKKNNLLLLIISFTILSCSSNDISNSDDNFSVEESIYSESISSNESIFNSQSDEISTSFEEKGILWNTDHVDVSHINPDNRLIALTFDDGPNSTTSNKLIDAFNQFNEENPDWIAHPTVFYKGNNINEETGEIIKKAYAAGFEIGNHTYSHSHLETMNKDEIINEVNSTLNEIKKYVNIEHTLVRPPFGTVNDLVKNTIPYPLINWTTTPNLDTHDYESRPIDFIYSQVFTNAIDGGIVLMHEGYSNTIAATKKLLTALKDKGFQVCSISELAKVRGISLYSGNVYNQIIEE